MNVKPLQLYGGGLVQMEVTAPRPRTRSPPSTTPPSWWAGAWTKKSNKPYWLVKNSYGQDWGEMVDGTRACR